MNCSLQRPLDDQTQPRVEREAEAIIQILAFCEKGDHSLVSSEILLTEINDIADLERRETTLGILSVAAKVILVNNAIKNRAQEFEASGIKAIDALHLASAEAAAVEFFCTCDDRFLRKARARKDLRVRVVSPLELREEMEK